MSENTLAGMSQKILADLPPFPEIPLTPEQKLRWADWGRQCMAKGMERAAGICEQTGPKDGPLKLVSDGFALAIRSAIGKNGTLSQE